MTLCMLRLKAQDVGSTRLETRNLYFLLDQLINATGKRCAQVLLLLTSYALRLKQLFQYRSKKNKNHQIKLPKGRIQFSSLDVADQEEPKYQIRNPYELTNAINITDDKYKDCFFYNQRFPQKLQMIVYKYFMVPRTQ